MRHRFTVNDRVCVQALARACRHIAKVITTRARIQPSTIIVAGRVDGRFAHVRLVVVQVECAFLQRQMGQRLYTLWLLVGHMPDELFLFGLTCERRQIKLDRLK